MINEKELTPWFLRGELKDGSPWIVPVNRDIFTMGRSEENDLILSSSAVSRRHARLTVEGDDLYITDLESKNGLTVNGKTIAYKSVLREGDLLRIGTSEFTLSRQGGSPEDEKTLAKGDDRTRVSFADMYGLSEREYEILYFLVRGRSLKQIGESLFITPGTVKNHVLKIYKKTDCHTRIELSTRYAEFKGEK